MRWIRRHPIPSAVVAFFAPLIFIWYLAQSVWASFSEKPMIPTIYNWIAGLPFVPNWPHIAVITVAGILTLISGGCSVGILIYTRNSTIREKRLRIQAKALSQEIFEFLYEMKKNEPSIHQYSDEPHKGFFERTEWSHDVGNEYIKRFGTRVIALFYQFEKLRPDEVKSIAWHARWVSTDTQVLEIANELGRLSV
jgi:hypothetical protein